MSSVAGIEPDMCPKLGFKSGGLRYFWALQERVDHGRKFDSVDQLKQAGVTRIDYGTASDKPNGNVVCSLAWIRMADTLNTRFTRPNCLYRKIIVVTDVVLKYFLWSTARFFPYNQHGSDVLVLRHRPFKRRFDWLFAWNCLVFLVEWFSRDDVWMWLVVLLGWTYSFGLRMREPQGVH